MWFRIVARLSTSLGVAWAKLTAVLLVLHVLPGPVQAILAGRPDRPGQLEAIAAQWGPQRSPLQRYLDFLFRTFDVRTFDGNWSISEMAPANVVGLQLLLPTVELTLLAAVLAILLSGALTLLTAGRRYAPSRIALESVFASTPMLWFGLLLLIAFAFDSDWFAASGAELWWSLGFPSVALALPTAALLTPVLREAMEDASYQPLASKACASEVADFVGRSRRALQRALMPIVMLGGWLIGGFSLAEMILGVGAVGPALARDIQAVLTVVLLAYFAHVAASMVLDSIDLFIDWVFKTPWAD